MMQTTPRKVGRRALITGTALAAAATAVRAAAQAPAADTPTTLADVPLSTSATITVERRGEMLVQLLLVDHSSLDQSRRDSGQPVFVVRRAEVPHRVHALDRVP